MNERDSWAQWSKYVLAELKRINEAIDALDVKIDRIKDEQISQLKIEIAMLKVKAGVWGLLGGALPVIIFIGQEFIQK